MIPPASQFQEAIGRAYQIQSIGRAEALMPEVIAAIVLADLQALNARENMRELRAMIVELQVVR